MVQYQANRKYRPSYKNECCIVAKFKIKETGIKLSESTIDNQKYHGSTSFLRNLTFLKLSRMSEASFILRQITTVQYDIPILEIK